MKQKQIYFHVGLGKTATTFLQYRVFPELKGIRYIQRTRYKKSPEIINASRDQKFLVSREFDQQLEREVNWFSAIFPGAVPIIVFRRHDDWIASQYRRFVKNGYRLSFTQFFDLDHNRGYFRMKDLEYSKMICFLEKKFNTPPIVLIYEDLKNEPHSFIRRFAEKIDAEIDLSRIDFSRKHRSYSPKQLKAIQWVGKYMNLQKRDFSSFTPINFICRSMLEALRYTVLFAARFLPDNIFGSSKLIPQSELKKIRDYFDEDWQECIKSTATNHF